MQISGKVESVLVGDKNLELAKTRRGFIVFKLDGIEEDKHAGFIKNADVRDRPIPKRVGETRVQVRNWRQWSAVSIEENGEIANELQVEKIEPEWLGANLSFSGIKGLSLIPKGSTIWFPEDTVLTVEDQNQPCVWPGQEIAKHYPEVDQVHFPPKFVKAAMSRRGLVGTVYRAGIARVGDEVKVQIYEPKHYSFA
ncbi:MOSC domain-containing protein [Candidatus Gottesmanbacteria bacterium]|nr:MOSC domain-containing protein [Candidatus Gottesmanbacteria bacterium]